MRPSLALLCVSAFCLLNSWPSSAADIVVRVLDASDQTPLPGATLAVLGTEFGGYANEEGYCRVEGLPPGQYDLLCSHIGYRSHTLRGVVPGTRSASSPSNLQPSKFPS